MKKQWLSNLSQCLDYAAPTVAVSGICESRKVEGLLEYSVEGRCYGKVVCYIQKGIGEQHRLIGDVLHCVDSFQIDNGRGPHAMNLYVFSAELNSLAPINSRFVYPGRDMYGLAKEWCKLAGNDLANSTSIISQLGEQCNDELHIFFGNDRSVKMNAKLRRRYQLIRDRALWCYVGGETPEWVMSQGFEPDYVEI
jgi:hypothetical protein